MMNDYIAEYRKKKEKIYSPYIVEVKRNTNGIERSVDTEYGPLNLTVYRSSSLFDAKAPIYFNFHGGGFVLGFYEQDGILCQEIAEQSDCIVVNIDYPLAPEHKFPIPIKASAEAIINFLKEEDRIDPRSVALGGFSAGGNLALSTSLHLKEAYDFHVNGLVTVYAPLDFSIDEKKRNIKFKDKAISPERLTQYKESYFNHAAEYKSPLGSPIFADPNCFPATLVISAEYDSLCEEEERFAKRLEQAGTPVQYACFENVSHGYTHTIFDYHEKHSKETIAMIAQFLRKLERNDYDDSVVSS